MTTTRFYWLLFGLAVLVVAFFPLRFHFTEPQEREFRIYASQYAYSPAKLSANPGDTVTIELVSTDVVHGLYIDGYGVSVTADPGETARLTFTADRPGAFRLRCNVTCGALHPFMIGKLQVGTNSLLWRAIGLSILTALAGVMLFKPPTQIKTA